MRPYEITYLITPMLTEGEASTFHEKMKKMVEENSGKAGQEQVPTKKTLAYPIKKNTEGYLSSFDFEIEEKDLEKVKENISKEDSILRHIIIQKDPQKEEKEEKREEKSPKKKKSLKPEKAKLKEIDEKIEEML